MSNAPSPWGTPVPLSGLCSKGLDWSLNAAVDVVARDGSPDKQASSLPVNPMTAAPACHKCHEHITSDYKCRRSALTSRACLRYSNDDQEVSHLFSSASYAWSSGADRT